ncbi:MAG: GNAT family N-acetyltransferase [Chitinophagaceae bacterium]|nr:GNAT family N-acetyltransferase [Chitinophagaceae bacterium]
MTNPIDNRDIFLRGKHVYLKALTRDDVIRSNWYGWFNDEELCKTLQQHYYPNTLESQLEFYQKNIAGSSSKIQLGICKTDNADILGVISLNNIDYINSKAEISAVIGEPSGRNINIFRESCVLICQHAFNTLNLNKVYGGSISKELAELMCKFLKGKMEGVIRSDIYKNGAYHDAHVYGILKEDFYA